MTEIREIENAILRHPDPVVTVPELLRDLDDAPSDTTLRELLGGLEAVGKVDSKKPGSRARVYWHSERVNPPLVPADDHPDQTRSKDHEEPQADAGSQQRDDRGEEPTEAGDESLAALLADWRPGRTREEREERHAVAVAALRELRDDGRMTRADFESELLPAHSIESQSPDTWWRKTVRPGLNAAKEEGLVTLHHGPPHEYEWVGR